MTDEQKQEAEPTIEMFVDWDEAYPVYYMSESDDSATAPNQFGNH